MTYRTLLVSYFFSLTQSSPLTKGDIPRDLDHYYKCFLVPGCTAGGSPCQIPFTYRGTTYFECITEGPGGGEDLFGRCPVTESVTEDPGDWAKCDRSCPLQRYTENREINTHLQSLVDQHPRLASLVTVGSSSLGQQILGIRITRGVTGEREMLKPMFRYSGNMHGNEPVGREMLNHLAEVLLKGYGL